MTHLGFVAASYALGVVVPVGFALSSALRLSAARRKLASVDPRRGVGRRREVSDDA